jgi:hypothetical protein
MILRILLTLSWVSLLSQTSTFSEKDKINYLLDELVKSKLIFIRNGDSYSAQEAKAHMEKKLEYGGNRITNVDQFITYIATKSSISGKPYYVQFPDGKKIESSVWLRDKLKKLEESK